MSFGGGGMAWGDIDDDDDSSIAILPPTRTTGPDKNGVKTVVSYKIEDGVRYKMTERVRVYELRHRISKAAIERQRTWQPFGDALEVGPETNKGLTYTSYEDVFMDSPESKKEDEQEKTLNSLLNWAKGRKSRWRDGAAGGEGKGGEGEDDNPNRYIAPHMRGQGKEGAAASAAAMMASTTSYQDDGHTIRVTNISEDTAEVDLQELFRPFGRTTRIYLAKDRVTMISRGFAFVTFMHREDAEKAIEKLNGYGYDHLILCLEWSKPRVVEGGGGGGFRTGYGKALPQGLG